MTVPTPADEDLEASVRAAQSGDQQALTRLVERCHQRVFRWALVRTGDADDADDVAQTVMVRLSTHLDRYDGRSKFTTWLYRVTANAAGGFWRRRQARSRAEERMSMAPDDTARDDPLERVAALDVLGLVRTLLKELPARQREVFDLADLQGFTPAEVGEMLEMSAVTVRANLFRARRTMRARMLARDPKLAEEHS